MNYKVCIYCGLTTLNENENEHKCSVLKTNAGFLNRKEYLNFMRTSENWVQFSDGDHIIWCDKCGKTKDVGAEEFYYIHKCNHTNKEDGFLTPKCCLDYKS